MNETDVAEYLLAHPAFFDRHAELLGRIRLANPYGARAISLPERQIDMLREKNRQYERRLSELVRYGHENDSLGVKFDRWSARLLEETDTTRLPDRICAGLRDIFDVPAAAVRLWRVAEAYRGHAVAHGINTDIERYTSSLGAPYCGPNTGFAAAQWLSSDGLDRHDHAGVVGSIGIGHHHSDSGNVEAPEIIQSIALVPLRLPHTDPAGGSHGLLVLGSPDPQRFHADMGTDFLLRIGALTSAALSRLAA